MKIIISSLSEMRRYHGKVSHLLAMVDPDDAEQVTGLGLPKHQRCLLLCDDVESQVEATRREHEQPGSRCVAPTLLMVRKALDFARPISESDVLLVVCGHGISRSTALALAVMAQTYPSKTAPHLLRMLLDLRPQASPNALIVAYADSLLNRGESLSKAILARFNP